MTSYGRWKSFQTRESIPKLEELYPQITQITQITQIKQIKQINADYADSIRGVKTTTGSINDISMFAF